MQESVSLEEEPSTEVVIMASAVNPVPEQYHSITPNLVCRNAAAAIEFYKKVFDATEIMRHIGPGGEVMHAELKIGDSTIFVNDTMSKTPAVPPEPGTSNPVYLHLYIPNADAVFNRAIDRGARVDMPIADMFWGDRYGRITDPFGQQWGIASRIEDIAPRDLARRQNEFFAKAAGQS